VRPAATSIPKAMPKSNVKSPKKSDKKKSKPADPDSHPLNSYFPSAAMSGEDARATPMDVDGDAPAVNGNSQPPTPSHDAPGAFPSDVNGDHDREDRSPTPPPHKVQPAPKVDPEACKAAGNKFFKAKDYDRAIQEYSKGRQHALFH
jgi:DnaJ homolog subfamily C member 7